MSAPRSVRYGAPWFRLQRAYSFITSPAAIENKSRRLVWRATVGIRGSRKFRWRWRKLLERPSIRLAWRQRRSRA